MPASPFVPALPTLAPTALLPTLEAPHAPVFPLDRLGAHDDAHARLYYLARNGIFHGLRALGVAPGDLVLMPSYHHGVEVEAVRQTGAEVVFYRVDRSMRVDLDDARRRARGRAIKALYVTHLAGWPQPIDDARTLADELGAILVEDCALSLFSRDSAGRPLGQHGDLAVFCLYKTLPVPHGGVAIARSPLPPGLPPPAFSTAHHLVGAALARAALQGGRVVRALREVARRVSRLTVDRAVQHVQVGTQHLRPEELHLGASTAVPRIVRRIDPRMVVVRRRRNFMRLHESLGGDDKLLGAGPLPDGACPLFYPLVVRDRRAALQQLWAGGVDAIDFWSHGDPRCDEAEHADTAHLRKHVIEIPIHQDLDDEAMDHVAAAVKQVVA